MARLKLQPDPTFKAKVAIPVPGAAAVDVEFTFKHRTRDELEAFLEASRERKDVDTILDAASGWELLDAFSRESVELLVQNYILAPRQIYTTYVDELARAREKNS